MKNTDVRSALDEIRTLLRDLTLRIERLEAAPATPVARAAAQQPPASAPAEAPPPPPVEEEMSEEIMLVIAAAVAAFCGERAHLRQVRLISSQAWAQQGRVSVQASHRLHRGS